jgi:hydroxypyruvate reductase
MSLAWNPRHELMSICSAALKAVDPVNATAQILEPRPRGRLAVVGAGKASARMALAVESYYGAPLEGVIVTRYGHGEALKLLELVEAGHPVPDQSGYAAAGRILALAKSLGDGDRLLVLLSGGGSALLSLPAQGVPFKDKRAVSKALLESGAPIGEINIVRKHLSRIKAGRLAAAAFPAETVTLAISDVPGDDPAVIASGPTVADPSSLADAKAILKDYGIDVPQAVARALDDPKNESIKPGDPRLSRSRYHIVARPRDALAAVEVEARAQGYAVLNLGDRVEGEARAVAFEHARLAESHINNLRPIALISGGELTVTGAPSNVSGGRNREYALALAIALNGKANVAALAIDTDGIDGSADAAGAVVLQDTLAKAASRGLNATHMLAEHRSGELFAAIGDALVTGPTRTNVGDLRILLIWP